MVVAIVVVIKVDRRRRVLRKSFCLPGAIGSEINFLGCKKLISIVNVPCCYFQFCTELLLTVGFTVSTALSSLYFGVVIVVLRSCCHN